MGADLMGALVGVELVGLGLGVVGRVGWLGFHHSHVHISI